MNDETTEEGTTDDHEQADEPTTADELEGELGPIIRTEKRKLEVKLAAEVLEEKAGALARYCVERGEVEDEKKEAARHFRERLKTIGGRIDTLADEIRSGAVKRPVPCVFRHLKVDSVAVEMVVIREDTGEILERRPLQKGDQAGLDLGEQKSDLAELEGAAGGDAESTNGAVKELTHATFVMSESVAHNAKALFDGRICYGEPVDVVFVNAQDNREREATIPRHYFDDHQVFAKGARITLPGDFWAADPPLQDVLPSSDGEAAGEAAGEPGAEPPKKKKRTAKPKPKAKKANAQTPASS